MPQQVKSFKFCRCMCLVLLHENRRRAAALNPVIAVMHITSNN